MVSGGQLRSTAPFQLKCRVTSPDIKSHWAAWLAGRAAERTCVDDVDLHGGTTIRIRLRVGLRWRGNPTDPPIFLFTFGHCCVGGAVRSVSWAWPAVGRVMAPGTPEPNPAKGGLGGISANGSPGTFRGRRQATIFARIGRLQVAGCGAYTLISLNSVRE